MIATRGNKESVDLFIKELGSKYLQLPMTNKKNGAVVNTVNPIHVRPFQLWEIIFPKEDRDLVLTTLFPEGQIREDHGWKKNLVMWFLNKFLPFYKIPEKWDTSKKLWVNKHAVEIAGLGLKDDEIQPFKRSPEQMKAIGLDVNGDWEFEGL